MTTTKYGWDNLPPLEPLDIVLTRPDSMLSCGIAWFTQGYREGRTWARHVGMGFGRHEIWESTTPRSRVIDLSLAYRETMTELVVFRSPAPFTPKTKDDAQQWMADHVGRRYGWWRFFPEAGDGLVSKLFRKRDVCFFRKIIRGNKYLQCSPAVGECYQQILGVKFMDLEPRFVMPDDIADHVVLNKWPCVWATSAKAQHDLMRTSQDRRKL